MFRTLWRVAISRKLGLSYVFLKDSGLLVSFPEYFRRLVVVIVVVVCLFVWWIVL